MKNINKKDLITIYQNYLYCLEYIKKYDNKYGDVDVKNIYVKALKLQKHKK